MQLDDTKITRYFERFNSELKKLEEYVSNHPIRLFGKYKEEIDTRNLATILQGLHDMKEQRVPIKGFEGDYLIALAGAHHLGVEAVQYFLTSGCAPKENIASLTYNGKDRPKRNTPYGSTAHRKLMDYAYELRERTKQKNTRTRQKKAS